MKKTFFPFVLAFVIQMSGFSVAYSQIVVSSDVKTEKEKPTSIPLETASFQVIYKFDQQARKDHEPIILTDTMALTVGQRHSVYFDWNKQRNDSIDRAKADIPIEKIKSVNVLKDESALQTQLESLQEPTFITDESKGESARVYKDREKHEIMTIDKGPMEGGPNPIKTYLQVTEIIPPQDWTITEDTLTVLGYACQKAMMSFRGRKYVAWFTLDIPVGEGPWKFYGLPGLILKAEDADGIFCFNAIGINQSSNENIEIPIDQKMVSSSLKQLRDYRKNRFKELMYGFFNGGTLNMFRGRNPVVFNELEKE